MKSNIEGNVSLSLSLLTAQGDPCEAHWKGKEVPKLRKLGLPNDYIDCIALYCLTVWESFKGVLNYKKGPFFILWMKAKPPQGFRDTR